MAHIFSQGTIKQMEPFVQAAMVELTKALGKRTGKPVDALHWTRMTALDISGEPRSLTKPPRATRDY